MSKVLELAAAGSLDGTAKLDCGHLATAAELRVGSKVECIPCGAVASLRARRGPVPERSIDQIMAAVRAERERSGG